MYFLSLLIGLVLLVVGSNMLVRGGGQLALALRVPALVVGLTVVAFGTSSPELLVSVTAALEASTDMALGNVNGSNIANILLVLGLAAMVRPLTVDPMLMRREIPACLGLQVLVLVLCLDGRLSRGDGFVLLMGGVAYNALLLYSMIGGRTPAVDDELNLEDDSSWWSHLATLVAGIVILVLGANLFVSGAEVLALKAGLSQRFVGLTVVAMGTSAPEVATGMMSAYRGEVDLAVGNSLGSNLLNIAMVLGITAMIAPIGTDVQSQTDVFAACVVTVLLVFIVLRRSLSRFEGAVWVSAYVGYLLWGYLAS